MDAPEPTLGSSPLGSAFFRALVESSTDAVTVIGADGNTRYTSPAAARMNGYEASSMDGASVFDFIHPEDMAVVTAGFVEVLATEDAVVRRRFRLRVLDGTWRPVESVATNHLDDKDIAGIVVSTRDDTDRTRAEGALRESEERYRRLVEHSPEAIAVLQDDAFVYVNPAGMELLGATTGADLIGRSLLDVLHPEDAEGLEARVRAVVESKSSGVVERRLIRLDGCVIDVELVAVPIDLNGAPAVQVMARDVTDRRRAERALAHQALHDHLTGLPNRALLLDRLAQAQARSARTDLSVAVLFLDLDRFKAINDDLGHEAGDRVLLTVATRVSNILRPVDTFARFGGDEFVVVCGDMSGPEEACAIADRIVDAVSLPMSDPEDDLHIGVSVGIAVATDADVAPDALIRDADAAMYRAKERGRGRIELFDEGMRSRLVNRIQQERLLRHAVERDELRLHYQPVLALPGLEVVGVEALVRWQHPERGLVAPADFIPLAEESGLINDVGSWVLSESCRQARAWEHVLGGDRRLEVAVNLSTRQLIDPDLVKNVADLLGQNEVEPHRVTLCLEITESFLLEDPVMTSTVLEELRRLDVCLAIDDFGTGYSSLAYLRRFPVDVLKIDRSFVCGLVTDVDSRPITVAIIEMAHALGLQVVAEGVEEQAQLDILVELGCDLAQGFLFARPMPPSELTAFLEQRRDGGPSGAPSPS